MARLVPLQDKEHYEEIEIVNFLAIRTAKISLAKVSVLIGPQASGKSLIAKAIYFCRLYTASLFFDQVFSNTDRHAFNSEQAEFFYEIFPGADEADREFSIKYEYCGYEIRINKSKKNRRLRIGVSNELASLFLRLKRDYQSFRGSNEDNASSPFYSRSAIRFRVEKPEVREFYMSIPSTLYVPAARSFFSTLEKTVLRFVSESKNLDPIIARFGQFYDVAKDGYDTTSLRGRPRREPRRDRPVFEEVLQGQFFTEADEDYLRTPWGRVKLSRSSSGQQEALPLLLALEDFPSGSRLDDQIIIEEPEAHLYPEAQRKIVDHIVRTAIDDRCNMLITTHSPYVLACLNNCIANAKDLTVTAFFISNGKTNNIFDEGLNIIETDEFDKVSEKLAREFFRADT